MRQEEARPELDHLPLGLDVPKRDARRAETGRRGPRNSAVASWRRPLVARRRVDAPAPRRSRERSETRRRRPLGTSLSFTPHRTHKLSTSLHRIASELEREAIGLALRRDRLVVALARGDDLGVRVAGIQDAGHLLALDELAELAEDAGRDDREGLAGGDGAGGEERAGEVVDGDVGVEEARQEDLLALGVGAPEAPARE